MTVLLAADSLDETGFVLDTTVIGELKNAVDHRFLNDLMVGENKEPINPTSENLAKWLGQKLIDLLARLSLMEDVRLVWIKVRETESTEATWYPYRVIEGLALLQLSSWFKTVRFNRWLIASNLS